MKRLLSTNVAAVFFLSERIAAFTSICPPQLTFRRPKTELCTTTAIDLEEEAQRDIASFEEWATYGGIQRTDGFQLSGEELDGFLDVSAMTTQDIPGGEPVLYIPNEMILSSNKAMEEFGSLQEAEKILRENGYESEIRQVSIAYDTKFYFILW